MQILCTTPNCGFNVTYESWEVPVVSLLTQEISLMNLPDAAPLPADKFNTAVKKVVLSAKNAYNTTKTVYLTCDNTATPHTNAYQVPSK